MSVQGPRALLTGTLALLSGLALVGCGVASSSSSVPTHEAIQLALPGGEWVDRGDEHFAAAMGEWSDNAMAPGEVAQRSYLVRNVDARPGVWTVTLGKPETSDNAFFAVGTQTLPIDAAVPEFASVPEAPAATPAGSSWLAGGDTAERENIAPGVAGEVLASIELGSCQAAAVTDWVAYPEVHDNFYQGATARPNIHVEFTPHGDSSEEFIPAQCERTSWSGLLLTVTLAVWAIAWAWHQATE